jgi:hypothetical protein
VWKGRPLSTYSAESVFRSPEVLSPSAFQFLHDTMPVPALLRKGSAVDLMALMLCNDLSGLPLMHIDQGYQALPNLLRDRFVERVPDGFQPYHQLTRVDAADGGATKLHFKTRSGATTVKAGFLILAMPQAALESFDDSPVFQGPRARQLREDLRTVEPLPLLRQYASYARPWWNDVNVTSGPGFTTLPIRISFALGTQGEQPGAPDPDDTTSLFLVSFRERELGGTDQQQQVRALFQGADVPAPLQEVQKYWQGGLVGGAAHIWRPGVKSEEIAKRMLHPIAGVNLHICGEAYSLTQGWTEGAFGTCKDLLHSWNIEFLPPLSERAS